MKVICKSIHSVSKLVVLPFVFSTVVNTTHALDMNCQYEGTPESVIRLQAGFGDVLCKFTLTSNSPHSCPAKISAVQFAGSAANREQADTYVKTIKLCLDMADLITVRQKGFWTVDLRKPLYPRPGLVIGNHEAEPVINSCRISSTESVELVRGRF